MSSPTQRTLKMLRDRGYFAQVVEKWNMFAKVRQDLFGFIDIVAICEGERGVLGVQATSSSNISAREAKCRESKEMQTWLRAGNRLWIVGWGKRGPRGKRKTWEADIRQLELSDSLSESPKP